jgi:hypothetical protein
MSKQKVILIDDIRRQRALQLVKTAPDGYVMTLQEPARNLDQNALVHALYADIAQALPDHDALGWKSYCKLHHGVPILRAEDDDFRAFYDGAMKKALSYEQKIEAMKFVPVTSLMTKSQLSKYAEAVRHDFSGRGVYLNYDVREAA